MAARKTGKLDPVHPKAGLLIELVMSFAPNPREISRLIDLLVLERFALTPARTSKPMNEKVNFSR